MTPTGPLTPPADVVPKAAAGGAGPHGNATPTDGGAHRRELWLLVLAAVIEVKLLDELGDRAGARSGVDRVLVSLAVAEAALPAAVVKDVDA